MNEGKVRKILSELKHTSCGNAEEDINEALAAIEAVYMSKGCEHCGKAAYKVDTATRALIAMKENELRKDVPIKKELEKPQEYPPYQVLVPASLYYDMLARLEKINPSEKADLVLPKCYYCGDTGICSNCGGKSESEVE